MYCDVTKNFGLDTAMPHLELAPGVLLCPQTVYDRHMKIMYAAGASTLHIFVYRNTEHKTYEAMAIDVGTACMHGMVEQL